MRRLPFPKAKRLVPAAVFVIVAALGAVIVGIVYQAIRDAAQAEFQARAEEAVDRVTARFDEHVSLLSAAHALFVASRGDIGAGGFGAFVAGLGIESRYGGIQGIGYAETIPAGDEAFAAARIAGEYGIERPVWPAATDQAYRTPIVLLEPRGPRNEAALGYDMFSDADRRAAMLLSIGATAPVASAPVQLAQEITSDKETGFLVYLPFYADGSAGVANRMPDGFVYAAFRAGDLHAAVLETDPALPVVLRTYDVSGPAPTLLYETPDHDRRQAADPMTTTIESQFAGRTWRFEIASTGSLSQYADFLPVYALCAVVIVLAGSLAAGARWQHKAVESAIALNEASRRSLEEKEFLLQEMRHRIKNSLSRVMAIARQTASTSATLKDFTASFSSRMNAMARAQDLLARSHWGRADLADLLKTELGQVFGEGGASVAQGPAIDLNERAAQALGLVFHELATNALKYSGVADGRATLAVHWDYEGEGDGRVLVLVWREDGNVVGGEPENKGFGSRLVEAGVTGELHGEIERRFDADGMRVTFRIPAGRIA